LEQSIHGHQCVATPLVVVGGPTTAKRDVIQKTGST